MNDTKPALPEPFDYCYEWDGPYGTRKFSAAAHNGMKPARSVPIYRADQMHAYADQCTAAAQARIAELNALLTDARDMLTILAKRYTLTILDNDSVREVLQGEPHD